MNYPDRKSKALPTGPVGVITAVCTSESKGTRKINVGSASFIAGHGIKGDAHAGPWHRQISLLAEESIEEAKAKGLNVKPGDFAENLTTKGMNLVSLPIGTRLLAGDEVLMEVTQIGKKCHTKCEIFRLTGDCVMPREGIFARVIIGGQVNSGDQIRLDTSNRIAIITVSDKASKGLREDTSACEIRELIGHIGPVVSYSVVPDEKDAISKELISLCDEQAIDLIITTGGTGLGPRDVTPEATLGVIDKQTPGFSEAMRMEGLKHTPRAMLSRATSGIRGKTLIINLPGSPKGVRESLGAVVPVLSHGLSILKGTESDCGI